VFGGVVVAVGLVLDADGFEDGVVIGPCGVGNPDGFCVQLAFGELGGNAQCACSAEALGGFGAVAGDDFVVCAKEEDLGLFVVVGNAVDGQVVNIPSYTLKPGQVVGVREKAKSLEVITDSLAGRSHSSYSWLEWNQASLSGKFLSAPQREDIPEEIKEQLIVELYSK